MKTSLFIHLQALKVSESKRRPEKAERKRGRKAERERERAHWKMEIERESLKGRELMSVLLS